MKKIAVIGAGSWGTALAFVLAENGHHVYLHSHNEQVARDIMTHHRNQKYLPDHLLPETIYCSTDYQVVLQEAHHVLFVVPSHAMRETAKKAASFIEPSALVIHASKGIEIETSHTISEILAEELPASLAKRIVVLSGPSHAEEVIKRNPTTVVAASADEQLAEQVQSLFMNPTFRVYTNKDVRGVELGGSLKNIIGLAAGVSDGLGYGDNAKAALLTRGLMEMMRFGMAMGAQPQTFSGLAGIGDLIVTGTSQHSRNWRTGNLLAQGKKLEDILASLGMVAEGVKTTKAVYHISQQKGIDMPITAELYRILFEGKDPKQAVMDLMNRYKTTEF